MSTPTEYFQRMYAAGPDPWDFAGRWYEQRKRELILAALPRWRYRRAFEPACATGLLTERLAERCGEVLAVDIAPEAVQAARQRLRGWGNVTVEQRRVPQDWPADSCDLVVLAELGYYFDDAELERLLCSTVDTLEPGGTLIAVHWRRPVAEHVRLGDDVHAAIGAQPGLRRLVAHVEDDFRLEVFGRTPPPAQSVAQAEGLW